MNEIRPWLYVGKYRDTLDPYTLGLHRIEAMLQLAEAVKQPGITSLYLPVKMVNRCRFIYCDKA